MCVKWPYAVAEREQERYASYFFALMPVLAALLMRLGESCYTVARAETNLREEVAPFTDLISRMLHGLQASGGRVQVVLADPLGSVWCPYLTTGELQKEQKGYLVEGVGKDSIPGALDVSVLDRVIGEVRR